MLLPGGIDNRATLKGSIKRTQPVLGSMAQGSEEQILSETGLASIRASQGQEWAQPMPTSFLPIDQISIQLEFELAPSVKLSRTLTGFGVSPTSQAVAYDGLPADLKKRVADLEGRLKDSFGRMPARATRGGRVIPPLP